MHPAAIKRVSRLRSGHSTPSLKLHTHPHPVALQVSVPCWPDAALGPWSSRPDLRLSPSLALAFSDPSEPLGHSAPGLFRAQCPPQWLVSAPVCVCLGTLPSSRPLLVVLLAC